MFHELRTFDDHEGLARAAARFVVEAATLAVNSKGRFNIAVSGGSACHSGSTEPSHVLMAMGLDKNAARASLRFSLMKTAIDADVDHVLKVVPEAVERLRALSPVAAG